jgi:hypothetical protein
MFLQLLGSPWRLGRFNVLAHATLLLVGARFRDGIPIEQPARREVKVVEVV